MKNKILLSIALAAYVLLLLLNVYSLLRYSSLCTCRIIGDVLMEHGSDSAAGPVLKRAASVLYAVPDVMVWFFQLLFRLSILLLLYVALIKKKFRHKVFAFLKPRFFLIFLSSFMALLLFSNIRSLWAFAKLSNGWIIGDWLINYQGGFVRRGLGGSLLLLVSDLLKIPPNLTVAFFQILLYCSYFVILFLLIRKKSLNTWFLILLLSPATLLFPVYDIHAVGRKEIILFFLFALFVYCLKRYGTLPNRTVLLFSAAIAVFTFFHELIFFFIPYFMVAAFIESSIHTQPYRLSKYSCLLAGSMAAMVPLYLFGKVINGELLCQGLLSRGLGPDICGGILAWPNSFWIKDVYAFAMECNYFSKYSVALLLGVVPSDPGNTMRPIRQIRQYSTSSIAW